MPVDFDRSPKSDLGYSGWVQLADGEIYIVSYIVDDWPRGQIRGYKPDAGRLPSCGVGRALRARRPDAGFVQPSPGKSGATRAPRPTWAASDTPSGAAWYNAQRERYMVRPLNILYLHSHDTGRYISRTGTPRPRPISSGWRSKACFSGRRSARDQPARRAAPRC